MARRYCRLNRCGHRTGDEAPPVTDGGGSASRHDIGFTDVMTREHLLDRGIAPGEDAGGVWATGFAVDYGWLQVGTLNENGRPSHRRGVSSEPGVYFLGLPWLARRGSSFIWASGTTLPIWPITS